MSAHLQEWLSLSLRWLHLIAGAAWIGTSFYFNWLNHSFHPPERPEPGVSGELWAVHGGGFYRVTKYEVVPGRLPGRLHWFKWEAYVTWLTGIGLLAVVYYAGARAYLANPDGPSIAPAAAVAVGVGSLLLGWLAYDALCRSPLARRPVSFATISFLLAAGAAFGLTRLLSGRGAYIHVGAMLGTIMAGNVFRVIIPFQRQMVDAMAAGLPSDAELGRHAAMRSLHNNYLTLPVLFIMVSSHYPGTYGHAWNWAILAGISAAGVAARHHFNLKHQGRREAWLLPAAAAAMLALAFVTRPPATGTDGAEAVSFREARAVIRDRCSSCHSAAPTQPGFPSPPAGVAFDTPAEIRSLADRIHAQAVVARTMPLGNLTGMTDEERALLGRWVSQGARID